MRSRIRGWHPVLAGTLLALVLAPAASAQGRDTVGLITEIKPGRGRVEVKPAAGGDWRVAGPLLAVRAGDSVRATEDAAAVIVLTAGRGVVRVVAAVSPVVLPAGAGPDSKADKVVTLLESSLGFLSRTTKEAPKGLMATRSPVPPPVVLTPRASLVRPEGLAFEWVGSARGRYAVSVVGAGGPLLERVEVTGTRLAYPEGAPALQPGVRYTVEILSSTHPVQRAEFEVADPERARIVARDLTELEAALGPGASPSSLALVRAGYLADQRLFHEAREVLLRALRADAEQASLYVLLGNVYERTGLAAQAAEAFDEAQLLATRGDVPAGKP